MSDPPGKLPSCQVASDVAASGQLARQREVRASTVVIRPWMADTAMSSLLQLVRHNIMGWEREGQLPLTGPHLASRLDHSFAPAAAASANLAADVRTVEAATTGPAAHWYTVYGRVKESDAAEQRGMVMAAVGTLAFFVLLKKDI